MRFWIVLGSIMVVAMGVGAEDWPMFRHDAARSAITGEALAPPLHLQWVFVPAHGPEPAWPNPAKEKARVRFDEAFHVAVVGDAAYFGSSSDNKVYCLDTATGAIRWSTITGGPVRVAPTVADGRVYVGSDDGFAYCLNAADGAIVWRTAASFRDDKVLGNGKMISLWPVRTGVLVDKGVAYFAGGIFPHESIFVCAVNAADGTLTWRNDTCGEIGYQQEFGGISPQGPLLASDEKLFVPSGRAMPAAFDRASGNLLYYLSPGGKVGGTWALLTEGRVVAGAEEKRAFEDKVGSRAYSEAYAWFPGTHLVVAEDYAYLLNFEELVALDRNAFEFAGEWRSRVENQMRKVSDALGAKKNARKKASGDAAAALDQEIAELNKQLGDLDREKKQIEEAVHRWRRPCALQDALTLSGDYLYVGGEGCVAVAQARTGTDVWKTEVEGRACGLAVANGRLFVSTDTGKIYCFAPGEGSGLEVGPAAAGLAPADEAGQGLSGAAASIVELSGAEAGHCLVYGCGTGRLAAELAQRTALCIVGVEPDGEEAALARAMLDTAGLQGTRVTVDEGGLSRLLYADYFADLVVSETLLTQGRLEGAWAEAMRVVKPHGGVLLLGSASEAFDAEALCKALNDAAGQVPGMGQAEIVGEGRWVRMTRGALPGEGKWTHLYAEPGNTACSDDALVRGSLGTLWFGEPGPERMVERHARAMSPVAMDGRMFVQGENVVMAYDSYNGRQLWKRDLPGALRVRVDSDMGNLALSHNGLYVAAEDSCVRLDPATGEVVREYALPQHDGSARRWGYLAIADGVLLGSSAAPLNEPYAASWEAIVDEEAGTWCDFDQVTEDRAKSEARRRYAEKFKSNFPEPNQRAFWNAQQSGFLWHTMNSWPAWGSVDSPVGAVTQRIVASDSVFALDSESGEMRWAYEGESIAHPAIAVGDKTVFLADCGVTAEEKEAAMAERAALIAKGVWEKEGIDYSEKHADIRRVVALDLTTGEKRWSRVMDLTGCGGDRMGLAYKDGVLCFFGCFSNHDRELFKQGKLKWRRITAISGEDGSDLWSRPLDYLRRPLIVGDHIIIEPRACDLRTGAIKTRTHPLTGAETTWEFVRPGHCCSITSASPSMLFLRGYHMWYYDLEKDQGMLPYGAIRPGCWLNLVPANGLLLFPEASAGCTCSYPVRSTVVMKPKPEPNTWSIFVEHGAKTPVQHLAVNFGAPGDWRDEDGTMWFGYPHPPDTRWHDYGVDFSLSEEFLSKPAYFCENAQRDSVKATEKPWVFASGCEGLVRCRVPLLDEGQGPGVYTVRLYFHAPEGPTPAERVFDVRLQGKTVESDLNPEAQGSAGSSGVIREYTGIRVETSLDLELVSKKKEPLPEERPVLNGLEVLREDITVARGEPLAGR